MTKVHELFAEAANWLQGQIACRFDGMPTSAGDEEANCWCLTGGIIRCYPNEQPRLDVYKRIIERLGLVVEGVQDYHSVGNQLAAHSWRLIEWNDKSKRRFDEVKTLLKELDV